MRLRSKVSLLTIAVTLSAGVIFTSISVWRMRDEGIKTAADIGRLLRECQELRVWRHAERIVIQISAILEKDPDLLDGKCPEIKALIKSPELPREAACGICVKEEDGGGIKFILTGDPAWNGQLLSDNIKKYPALGRVVNAAMNGMEASQSFDWSGPGSGGRNLPQMLFCMPIPSNSIDAVFFISLPEGSFAALVAEKRQDIDAQIDNNTRLFLVSNVIITLVAMMVALFIGTRLTSPILELAKFANALGDGKLDDRCYLERGDELGDLAESLNKMAANLKKQLRDLEWAAKFRRGMEWEINESKEIQNMLIPHQFPVFEEHREFDIFADIIPAKEVCGDFYDFFFVDDDNLAIVLGDASGRGLPAALFMAVTRTLTKVHGTQTKDPGVTLALINEAVAQNNEKCMFMSELYSEFNIRTKEFTFALAGHTPPLLLRGGEVSELELSSGPAIGVLDGVHYAKATVSLRSGDKLLLFNDGIIDSVNRREEEFGKERFYALLEEVAGLSPRQICEKIETAIREHSRKAEIRDDITILVLEVA